MEHERIEKDVARRSALIYLPISFGAALLIFLAASLMGGYPPSCQDRRDDLGGFTQSDR